MPIRIKNGNKPQPRTRQANTCIACMRYNSLSVIFDISHFEALDDSSDTTVLMALPRTVDGWLIRLPSWVRKFHSQDAKSVKDFFSSFLLLR